ncbi:uncharacterized protein I303_105309 [Kwoniella dejecticola CBS 10117]|uniref:Uncharacterized protein n=1 Tax=Kwoniella dejecticola CBS 10117 TaxID=1296121 RepID=A0A1A6A2V6_9TREE|nr:uncharacterized protein I303_05244 [Kwoniella dejecticola CBS 10117]OBR84386.1 hypothetical protein I303_05244 [Kwoniella dejecticola CBS 10117]
MSSNELIPLFPSATHPAIPISAQILSTLRHLTAPGKGNDLKSEERAALVGVAALLGCEKIQSKDLLLSSAQKASSVSPAHFRSTLSKCRTLLERIPSPSNSPSGSPSKRSAASGTGRSPSKATSSKTIHAGSEALLSSANTNTNVDTSINGLEDDDREGETHTPSVRVEDVLSPLQTPKKKYKFSSGIDISSLVKSPRTPRTPRTYDSNFASPLRQSVTRQPSTKVPVPVPPHTSPTEANEMAIAEDKMETKREGEMEGEKTPSKKNKFTPTIHGVDLEHPPQTVKSVHSQNQRKRKGEMEDASSFFALRPGSTVTPSRPTHTDLNRGAKGEGEEEEEEEDQSWMHRRPEETHSHRKIRRINSGVTEKKNKKKKGVKKVDWTYQEDVWGHETGMEIEADLQKIWTDLEVWLAKHELPSIDDTQVKGKDVEEILMNAFADAQGRS